jgi:hypothetical protein
MTPVGVYVLNVGHGQCQIIHLSEGRAIVIDGGSATYSPLVSDFLSLHVETIVAYIATHNDEDHVGAAEEFLQAPQYATAETLQTIWARVDRPRTVKPIRFLKYALDRDDAGTTRFRLAELRDDLPLEPRVLFFDPKTECKVSLLYPLPRDTMGSYANVDRNVPANRASAIIRITIGQAILLIPGDADVKSFQHVKNYQFSLRADTIIDEFDWDDIVQMVQPKLAIVSSGSRTKVKSTTIQPLVNAGAHVVCTQLTKACHVDPTSFDTSVNPATVRDPVGFQRPEKSVACFGEMCLTVDGNKLSLEGQARHRAAVEAQITRPDGAPLCCAAPRPVRIVSKSRRPATPNP